MGIKMGKNMVFHAIKSHKLLILLIKLVRPAGLEPTPQASETCTLSS